MSERERTYYLAGPMRGYPQYNVPMFVRVAGALRTLGYTIISPAELDSKEIQAVSTVSKDGQECDKEGQIGGETIGQILGRDVQIICDTVQGIILLPGWQKSRGARIEVVTGLTQKDFQFLVWDDNIGLPQPCSHRSVQEDLHDSWWRK